MTDEELQRYVTDELLWDPKIDSEAIAVSAHDGIVTLRGTVGSFRQKREAMRAAERVYGVRNVNNKLDVYVLTEHRRQDAEIRGDVLQALVLDALVPTHHRRPGERRNRHLDWYRQVAIPARRSRIHHGQCPGRH